MAEVEKQKVTANRHKVSLENDVHILELEVLVAQCLTTLETTNSTLSNGDFYVGELHTNL